MKFLLSAARSAGAIRKLVFGLALAAGVTDSRADWSGQDIGGVGVSGSSSFVSGTASVSGGGTVFGGTADAFNYLSQPVSGDCEITAKITSLDNIDPSSAAGLVMRSTLDAGAVSVAVYSTSSNGTDFSVRNTTSGTSVVTPGSAQTAPAWLRLVKTGTTVAGYVSTDGLSWSLVSQSTVSFSSTYYVGMAVASNAPGTLATGLFTRVTLATNLPASVGGLSLWLRADGGVVMGASGSSVSQWNDHSVFGNNAVQITGTSQPTWIDSQLVGPSNSQPILRFDGTNDFLSIPDAGSLKPSQFTVFLVGKKQSAGSVNGVFFVKSSTTTAWADGYGLSKVNVSLPSTTGVAVFANNYGSKVSGILPSDTYAVLAGRYDGSQVTMSVTSTMTVVTTGTYLAGITNSTAPLLIGASGTNALQGDIAEMLLFNRALSDSEQQDIQAYLYSKYAIGAQPLLPTLTVAGSAPHGIYTSVPTQPVALGPLGAGVTVYYTTDGSDPTITSSVYDPSHPPVQTGSQMLKFKAFKTGYAPSPTFVPASYAIDSSANFTRMGLALWLRSDVGLATHLTTSGTIVTTKVDQWSDMSGGENDAFPVSSSNLPSLVSGTFGSFSGPLVATSSNFSSPGSCLSISDNPTLDLSQMTIIAVAASGGSGNSIVAKGSALSSSGYGLVTGTGAVLPADIVSGFWVNGLNAGWVKSGTSFHVLEGTFDGNVARFYIDNSLSGTAINSSPVAQNTEPLFVGGPLGSASNGGSIAEILIFNRVLSESELTGVEEYLLSRYNLGALHLSSGSPESGSYTTAQTVQVDIPSGAQVYYTTDGSEPTTGSTLYSGPITVSAPTILKFKGFKGSYPPGPTLTESYLIDSTATFNKAGLIVWMRSDLVAGGGSTWPDLSGQNNNAVATGDPHFPIAVHPPSLSSALIGSGTRPVLHFSVTGTLTNGFPSQASTDCLAIPDNASLKPSTMTMVVVGQLSGTTQSGVFLAKRDLGAATGYSIARLNTGTVGATINNSATVQAKSPLSPNTFSVMEGRYDQANSRLEFYQNGTLSQFYSTSAAVSYDAGPLYLGATGTTAGLDGDMAEVMVFDHALSVTDRQDVDAYLYFRYGLGVQPTAKTPQLTAGSSLGGSYTGSQTVQIDVPAGTQVYYTTDGSEPTMGSILYSGPITISSSTVLKFKAFNSPNYLPSATVTASYLIDPIATFNKTGLVAWMRADMVQTGSSGGASVSVWPDLSGKGNDAVQNSGTNQPTVISGTVVGSGTVPVLHFDGTNDFLAAPDAPSLRPTTMTMVVIGQQTGGGTSGIFAAKKISAAATGYSIARLGTGTDVGVVLNGSATIRAKGTLNVNTFSSMMGRYDQSASRLEFYQNGTLSQTSTTAVAISYDAGPLYIGATGTTAALQGDLAEVLLYDHALSTADRQDLEAYIYFRYGFGSQPTVIAPTLSGSTPSGGILSSNQSVSINVPLGSMVYYTTDGSGPTQGGGSSTLYDPNSPPVVSGSETLKFEAFRSGYQNSPILTVSYVWDSQTAFTRDGLSVWLRSDQSVATVSGTNTVNEWDDMSGHGNNATQPTSAKQPFLIANAISGTLSVVEGADLTEKWLSVLDNSTIDFTQMTMIVVGKHSNVTNWAVYADKTPSTAWTSGYGMTLKGAAGGFWVNSYSAGNAGSNVAAGAFHAFLGSYEGSTVNWMVDNVQQGSRTYSTALSQTTAPLYIGGESGYATVSKTSIAEVLLFNRVLTNEERNDIQAYLYRRYQIGTQPPAPTPQVAPGAPKAGIYPSIQSVSLTTPRAGMTIRYTTDGTDPTMSSTPYDPNTPIWITSNTVLKFVAFQDGFAPSAILTLNYVIDAQVTFPRNNLALWLRADQVASGTTAGHVAQWTDLSGNGNHAIQSVDTSQPTYVANQLRGMPTLVFDGSNDYLSIANAPSLNPAQVTAIVVGRSLNTTGTSVFASKGTAATVGYGLRVNSGTGAAFYINSPGTTQVVGSIVPGSFNYLEGQYSGTTPHLFINGLSTSGSTSAASITYDSGPLYLGKSAAGSLLKGDIAEVMVFSGTLSSSDKYAVENYLYRRYNIGLPPVLNTAPYNITLSSGTGAKVAPADVTLTPTLTGSGTTAINTVDYFQGESYLGTETQAPFAWQMNSLSPGTYSIQALATDALGRSATAGTTFQVTPVEDTALPGRYVMGTGTNPDYLTFVVPLSGEQGIQLDPMGDNSSKFPAGAPWFMQIAKSKAYFISGTNTVISGTAVPFYWLGYPEAFENPLVAFGGGAGGSPLYTGQTYTFGIGTGGLDTVPTSDNFKIEAYLASSFSATSSAVTPSSTYTVRLPLPSDSTWPEFVANNYTFSCTVGGDRGLVTTVQYDPAPAWGQFLLWTMRVSHQALSPDYKYKVSYAGLAIGKAPGQLFDYGMAVSDTNNYATTHTYDLSYTLDFKDPQPWTSTFITQPHFQGIPLPSEYQGKSLDELINNAPAVADTLAAPTAAYSGTDNSPELMSHPILDKFVADMGGDPMALANYVQNEINLTDPMGYTTSGTTAAIVGEVAINPTGVSRGALATYLEGAGSPAEQCGLLVYLLRSAGVPCGYIFPAHNQTLMFDEQLSHLLRMQLRGALDSSGNSNVPQLIPVNYPWVAAYINGKWIHLFPWIKDTAIDEGQDLFSHMPSGYQNGGAWTYQYLMDDPAIRGLDAKDDPATLFPLFIKKALKDNYPTLSISDMGANIYNRRHYYSSWDQFPRPWSTPVITSTNMVVNYAAIPNIFDTVSVKVSSVKRPSINVNTGTMRLVDIADRRMLIYCQQQVSGSTTVGHTLRISMEPYRPAATGTSAFSGTAFLLNKQTVSITLSGSDDALAVDVDVRRNRQLPAYDFKDSGVPTFLGFGETTEVKASRPLRKGDMAAFCMDYGHVTQKMLEVQAEKYWAYQQSIQNNPSQAIDVEMAIGQPLYLMGMSYYYKCSQFMDAVNALTKTTEQDLIAFGFSKMGPKRTDTGALWNGGELQLIYPKVDMNTYILTLSGNGTLHPDSGDDPYLPEMDATELNAVNGSAQEHVIINQFFQQSTAISTVKLLDIAQSGTVPIIKLDQGNYAALGSTLITSSASGTSSLPVTKTLMDWAGGATAGTMWNQITTALSGTDNFSAVVIGQNAMVLITPGPQNGAGGDYQGMGAMIITPVSYGALIDDNLKGSTANGGYGGHSNVTYPVSNPSSTIVTQSSMTPTSDGTFSFGSINLGSSPTITYAPSVDPDSDYANYNSNIASGDYDVSPIQRETLQQAAPIFDLSSSLDPSVEAAIDLGIHNTGFLGTPVYYGDGVGRGFIDAIAKYVDDPVNTVNGEFYIDSADLALKGPMPLEVRRNYGSQNLSDNNFGYGWKMAYFPYLVVNSGTDLIYAAEMDGSVVAYRQDPSLSTRWVPSGSDNPQLTNVANGSAGSMGNLYSNRIDQTTSGSNVSYTLTGGDGSVRTFKVQSFPIITSGTTTLSRQRPYLQKWQDNKGNYLNFSFGTNAAAVDYGELSRVAASNGTYVGFSYDTYGHITEAYSGDGRRLYYDYDGNGDLVQVTRPDASTIGYEYLQLSGTSGSYSSHLITRETKPGGRILENDYDAYRRVTAQRATVGSGTSATTPMQNAAFVYSNTSNTPNADGTFSGTTTITDVNSNQTQYVYQNNLITQTKDPLNQTVTQEWFLAGDGLTGTYPRSLKDRTDERGLRTDFQYDLSGNLVKSIVTGTFTGTSGSVETGTTTMAYSSTRNLVTQVTDPLGNTCLYSYSDTVHPYLPTSVEKRSVSGATVNITQFQYGDIPNGTSITTGTAVACGVLLNQKVAFGTPDESDTNYTYNSNGLITSVSRPTGTGDPTVVLNYTYNLRGELTSQTDALGRTTNFAYDDLGNPVWTEWHDVGGPLVNWEYNYYNQNGEIEWTQGARYSPNDYIYRQYDRAGRLSQEIKWRSEAKPDGSGVQAVDGNDNYATTFYTHDAMGNLIEVDDPLHHATTMTYDAIGRMLTQSAHDGDSGATVLSSGTYTYEPGGNVATFKDPLGGVDTKTYNSLGKLLSDTGPDGSVHQFRYDLDGRVVMEILTNGNYWTTVYDEAARTITHALYTSGGTGLATETNVLDRRGNVISKTDAEGNTFTTTYDDLNRPKTVTGPPAAGSTARRSVIHTYDAAGAVHFTVDLLGVQTVSYMDALQRPTLEMVRNADGTVAGATGYWYSPDHQSVTITRGSGASGITTTEYTNTFGQPILTKNADGSFQISKYDAVGNLVAATDEQGNTTSYAYDALDRLHIETLPSGTATAAQTTYVYDAAGHVLERQMPGGTISKSTYDTAGRKTAEELDASGTATRQYGFSYYTSGSSIGLLQSATDPRGFTVTKTYDSFMRPATVSSTGGSTPEQNQTTSYTYDKRNLVTQVSQSYASGTTGPGTVVNRTYDAYGDVSGETVSISGTTVGQWTQAWDAGGRRSALSWQLSGSGASNQFAYQYNAMDLMTQVAVGGQNYNFTYGDSGLLKSRASALRTQSITQRDRLGRITAENVAVNSTTPLLETMAYRPDSKLSIYASTRTGGPGSESRAYGYDARGRLLTEPFASPGADTFQYQFDGGTLSGLGLRTSAQVLTGSTSYTVSSQSPFHQATEDISQPASGSGVTVDWTYDATGNSTTRTLSSGATQTLTWDSFGRLLKVSQRDGSNNGYDWSAIYDGLGRRLRTVNQPVSGGSASGSPLTLDSIYDPEVEFGEIGIAINGARTWKVYGPDTSGVYGGAQGIGGLEATILESSGTAIGAVSNTFGDVIGSSNGSTVTWSSAAVGAYGVLPGGTAPVVDTSHSVLDATLWRSHYIDPTGFYYLGARYYDPSSGRFLSPDPLGHDSSPSLYDYADGDPVNGLDADGRFDTAHSLSTYSSPTMSTTEQILSALNGREISLRQTVSDPVPQLEVKGIVDHPTLNDPENEQRQELSDLVSYVPLLAQVQDFYEMSSGRNPFTGRYLSEAEQIGAGVNFLVGALTLGEAGAMVRAEMSFVERDLVGGLERSAIGNFEKSEIGSFEEHLAIDETPAIPSTNCFVAGTPVKTEQGEKAIEKIVAGDKVWATDSDTQKSGYHKVVRAFINQTEELEKITTSAGDKIECTLTHPFWTEDRGWVKAGELKVGEALHAADGSHPKVTGLKHLLQHTKVYNFEVEGVHSYYVGNHPLLVHNACGDPAAESTAYGPVVNSSEINFSQTTVNKDVQSKIVTMRNGGWQWERNDAPIRVMEVDGKLVSYDNRRLYAARVTGKNVAVIRVSRSDLYPGKKFKTWGDAFDKRLKGNNLPRSGTSKMPALED